MALCTVAPVVPQDTVSEKEKPKAEQTEEQKKLEIAKQRQEYLGNYCYYRIIAIKYVETVKRVDWRKSHVDISLDDLRPYFGMWLKGLSKDATWEQLMEHEQVKPKLKEEHREKLSLIFCGSKDARWIDILNAVEALRKQRDGVQVNAGAQATR